MTSRQNRGEIARRTLSAARFFFDQAGRVERRSVEHYGYYVEAAIVFAWMVLEHLEQEFSEKREAEQWIRNLQRDNDRVRNLKIMRNFLSHERPIGIIPSREDTYYIGESSAETRAAHDMLPEQLDEIEDIIVECERLFR